MNDNDAAKLVEMMMLGEMPSFTDQEVAMMTRKEPQNVPGMNAVMNRAMNRRISPRAAGILAQKAFNSGYDPSPDVGSIKGVANNPVSQAAGNLDFAAQRFGRNVQKAGPIGYFAGTAIEDIGNRAQKAAYGESDWYDPAMITLDAVTMAPGAYMSQGMRQAMNNPDAKYSVLKQLLGGK